MTAPQLTDTERLYKTARNMVPDLRARSAATAALGRLPEETVSELQDAGFFRIMQPARYGGYEMDPSIIFDLQLELGRGCASSAWVYGVLNVHSWQLALFGINAVLLYRVREAEDALSRGLAVVPSDDDPVSVEGQDAVALLRVFVFGDQVDDQIHVEFIGQA